MTIKQREESTSDASGRITESALVGVMRVTALIAVLAGAVGSLGLMLYSGRHAPLLLIVLFAIWVLSPFVALELALVVSKRWPVRARAALYGVTGVVVVGSLAVYGAHALSPPRAQGAFVFVVVPPASWLVSAVVLAVARLVPGRRSHRDDSV